MYEVRVGVGVRVSVREGIFCILIHPWHSDLEYMPESAILLTTATGFIQQNR